MLDELILRYPELEKIKPEIIAASELMIKTAKSGGKILLCGNGGSSADCDHIVGELMKGFLSKRPVGEEFRETLTGLYPDEAKYFSDNLQGAIPAISLTSQTAVLSAFANDVAPDMVYAQLVYGYGCKGDLLIAISTSGNSRNVVNAIKIARSKGLFTLALTGAKASKSDICDVTVKVPETETFKVQEYHLPIYHYLCAAVEKELY